MHNLHEAFVSSKKHDYETPQMFFDALDSVFHFTADLAATPETAKCQNYWTPEDDALRQDWFWKNVTNHDYWLNPPYGRMLPKFMKRCREETERLINTRVVALIPARPDRQWWDESIRQNPNCDVCFIQGRLKFGGQTNQAPFPSALILFARRHVTFDEYRKLKDLNIGHWIWREGLPR